MWAISTSLKPPPKVQEVDGLPQNCAEAGNALGPGKCCWQRRVHGDEAQFEFRVVPPQAQEQLGLDRLSADVAHAGRHNRDFQPLADVFVSGHVHAHEVPGRFSCRRVL